MSGFSGINQFGSLTAQNGTKVDYKYLLEKYDADGNGEISKDEFNTAIKEEKLDKVDFASINKNGDEVVDENEMAVYEQKYKMQEAVNAMSAQITKDFSGTKSKYIAQVTLELTNYVTEFANNYQGEVSGMAEAFSKELPNKYTQIKKNTLANEPSSFKSQVLDDIINDLQTTGIAKAEGTETISNTALTKIGKSLETEANKYIKANPQCSESELKAHLEEFLNQTDADKMKSAAETFKANAGSFGTYIDGDELIQLKEYAKDFLTEAVNNGVTVKLGSRNIATTNAITTALKSYTDGATLKADMETAIAGLSTVSKKDALIAQDKTEQTEAVEKNFSKIKGSDYQINTGLIDYSKIDGYYRNEEVNIKKHGRNGAKPLAKELLSNSLKTQFKEQITKMLQAQGISFDKVETIFENVFNNSVQEAADACVDGKKGGTFSHSKSWFNTKDLVDKFTEIFNTNIAKAIDEMNASNKDMDITDLDFTQAGKDENGEAIISLTGEDMSTYYASDKILWGTSDAKKMIDGMKPQILTKAHAMCEANGITFEEKAFETIFNNAKAIGTNLCQFIGTTKKVLNTFTENFKTNYTTWVETEANKTKNKK